MTVGLTGQDMTLSQGTAIAPNETVILSGQEMTLTQGTAIGISSSKKQI